MGSESGQSNHVFTTQRAQIFLKQPLLSNILHATGGYKQYAGLDNNASSQNAGHQGQPNSRTADSSHILPHRVGEAIHVLICYWITGWRHINHRHRKKKSKTSNQKRKVKRDHETTREMKDMKKTVIKSDRRPNTTYRWKSSLPQKCKKCPYNVTPENLLQIINTLRRWLCYQCSQILYKNHFKMTIYFASRKSMRQVASKCIISVVLI